MRVRRILFSPRPISVSFWPGLRPSAEAICVTFTLPPSGIVALLRRAVVRLALAEQIGHLLAPPLRHRARAGAALQRGEGRLHHVVRVAAAEALGDHVADAERLEHRTHRAAGDDAGARGGGTQHHRAGTILRRCTS